MIIYCSKNLEKFLGPVNPTIPSTSILGDWNGHLFTIHRRKCLLFMNNKTCYSVVMANVLKKDLKNFEQVFKQRLIRQFEHDLNIKEPQEIKLRNMLGDLVLTKSNNDKKIIGTINHHMKNLTYNSYPGNVENWDEVAVSGILNDYLVGTQIPAQRKKSRLFQA
jgi:hypothetical protein